MESISDLYPLTSLQIGDVQSYLSQAYLCFTLNSRKVLILVDNHSWRMSECSTSLHLRELFISKCRTSPFTNSRALLRTNSLLYNDNSRSSHDEWKNLSNVLSVVNAYMWRQTAIFSLVDLRKALHGFIVFEFMLEDIRGINYLNELQSDTTMALEVRHMRKWEFNGIKQASRCISSWFSGTTDEMETLQRCLIHLHNKVPSCSSREITVTSKELLFDDACQNDILSQEFFDVRECPLDANDLCSRRQQAAEHLGGKKKSENEENIDIESVQYKDMLLRFCFNDRNLPFKLKEIITSDIRLLMLLESGLPSWVIFLQSYPLFCNTYRPWMWPLFRTLYILISLVTVVIGFYDLYKNVPLLKAAASHLCGPLFDWIEHWDMISRVRYLGTMLFLQNFEKTVRWSLKIVRVVQTLLLLLAKPFMEPLMEIMELIAPIWYFFCEVGSDLVVAALDALMPFCSAVVDLIEFLFTPFRLLFSYIVTLVSLVNPIFNSLRELFVVPAQACLSMVMVLVNRATEVTRVAKAAKTTSHDISIWHSLWNDLFSKVLRSLRSIMYGLVVFLDTCIRHRHSTYTHVNEYIKQVSSMLPSGCHDRLRLKALPQESQSQADSQDQNSIKCQTT
ncbi:hypothetical protein Ancab_019874 [Ancistrocladus abbreviatus]